MRTNLLVILLLFTFPLLASDLMAKTEYQKGLRKSWEQLHILLGQEFYNVAIALEQGDVEKAKKLLVLSIEGCHRSLNLDANDTYPHSDGKRRISITFPLLETQASLEFHKKLLDSARKKRAEQGAAPN
jgi:hypothetical protein